MNLRRTTELYFHQSMLFEHKT